MTPRNVRALANITAAIIIIVIIIVAGIGLYYSSTISSKTTTVTSAAAPSLLIPISVALATPAQWAQLPLFIAMAQGYFKQNGLVVTPDFVEGAPPMFAALTSASTQFAMFDWVDVITLFERGEPVQLIYTPTTTGGFTLMSLPGSKYTNLASLQGQNVGVAAPDLTQWVMEAEFNASGYNPSTFAHFVYVGIGGTAIAALKAGTVVADLETDPTTTELASTGNESIVFDLRNSPIAETPGAAIIGLSGWMTSNPKTTEAFIKSLLEAEAFIHSNETGTINAAIASGVYTGISKSVLSSMYSEYISMMPLNGTAKLQYFKNCWDIDLIGGIVNSTQSFQTAYTGSVNDTYITTALTSLGCPLTGCTSP